jgi:hypothetical protein
MRNDTGSFYASVKTLPGKLLGILILFGFFVGLIAVVAAPTEIHKMAQAQAWPSRQGIVTHSSASEVFSRRRGTYWSFVIRGNYSDTGEPFVITRLRYGEFWLGRGKKRSMEAVAKYPCGSIVQVYYSPENPQTIILEPDAPRNEMYLVLATGIALVMLPFVLYLFRKKVPGEQPRP